ncbi:MAG: hypothetical protein HQK85_02165 [Nitrospinae bacterium]|nr:hypothetical protein [Nitrospinota bacterium]
MSGNVLRVRLHDDQSRLIDGRWLCMEWSRPGPQVSTDPGGAARRRVNGCS